jgi:WD40 repeat protein
VTSLETGQVIKEHPHPDISDVIWAPNGRFFVTLSAFGDINIWSYPALHNIACTTFEHAISIDVSPDSKFILTGSRKNKAKLWEVFGMEKDAILVLLSGGRQHGKPVHRFVNRTGDGYVIRKVYGWLVPHF